MMDLVYHCWRDLNCVDYDLRRLSDEMGEAELMRRRKMMKKKMNCYFVEILTEEEEEVAVVAHSVWVVDFEGVVEVMEIIVLVEEEPEDYHL